MPLHPISVKNMPKGERIINSKIHKIRSIWKNLSYLQKENQFTIDPTPRKDVINKRFVFNN